ncbi:GEVED domain-containing protein [Streptococcus sp. A34]|uniref:mucin-binding protein n=1 Tax=Streptococcus sp. A34 TaxID=3373130 RepID=UPI00374CBC91
MENNYLSKTNLQKWYAPQQRFSIRKYHFGAASVLLGVALALSSGATAAANTVESGSTTPSSVEITEPTAETSVAPASTETTTAEATSTPVVSERTATVEYTVEYQDETGAVVASVAKSTSTTTTDATAIAIVSETAEVPAGYALAAGEASTTSAGVVEGGNTKIVFKVVKKAVEATPVASTEEVAPATEATTEAVPSAEVEAAKEILEQVASEAAVLAGEGEKQQASLTAVDSALQTATFEASAVATQSEALLADQLATLDQINAQIDAVRTKVEALALELRKYTTDGEITASLNLTAAAAPGTETGGEDAIVYTGSEHFKNYDAADMTKIKKQITWLDFSAGNWSGLDNVNGNPALAVGATYKKEIAPGYVVEVTVSELKPFESTEYYYERVKGTDHEWTYNPDAVNSNKSIYEHGKSDYGNEARIIAAPQNQWSNARNQGLDIPGLVTLRSIKDGGNVGVKFTTKATYLGNEVPLNVVFMSGEEAGNSEVEIYTTNGDDFELFGELSNAQTTSSYKALGITSSATDYGFLGYNDLQGSDQWKEFFDAKYWANIATPESEATAIQTAVSSRDNGLKVVDGIGTKLFGPVSNHLDATYNYSTPIIMTKNASEVGMYIMASGRQSSMIGVVLLDYGDAPDSYGTGAHSINFNEADSQPYLGTKPADIDFIPEGIPVGASSWYRDELINQFDEGPSQLMGDSVEPGFNYTLHHSNDGTYTLKFLANANGNGTAYVQGWIDFNNDGRFDENENSGIREIIDGQLEYELNFSNIYQNVDVDVTKLGVRMRIALDSADIKTPDLTAYSGEVEDFQIQMTHPPRGEKLETTNNQGVTQTGTVEFHAYGENRYSTTVAKIDTTIPAQIVKADGTLVTAADLDADGYYVIAGEGKYKITENNGNVNVEFVPEADFITEYTDGTIVAQAKGISIRRASTVTDGNGVALTTGWHAKTEENGLANVSEATPVDGLVGTMDGRYIPHVIAVNPIGTDATSTAVQGATQTGTPTFQSGVTSGADPIPMGNEVDASGNPIAPGVDPKYPLKLVDALGAEVDSTDATAMVNGVSTVVGTYTIDNVTGLVTYTPNEEGKKYIGVVDSATVIARDINGASATATYTPTITPIAPIAEAATSVGVQGKEQTGTPTFEKAPTAPEGVADLDPTTLTLLDASGNPAKSVVVDGQGTYTLNEDGSITFTPLPEFVGTPTPVHVQMSDKNGTPVTTTYAPVVVEVKPVADPDESFGLKGEPQTSTPDFFVAGQVDLDGNKAYDPKTEVVDLDPATLTLLDASGNPATSVEVPGQGTYALNADGSVTFTPLPDFVGKATPVSLQIKDKNGTPVTTTYTPTVVEVPESELKESVTRTINYVYADGTTAAPSVTKTLEYTRTVNVDPNTGVITYGAWTSTDDDFPEVASPDITNFTPDLSKVDAKTDVPGDAVDETITVVYRENVKQLATITYKLENGTSLVELAKDGVEGHSGEAITYSTADRIAAYESLGYELVSDGFATATDKNYDADTATVQNFDVVLRAKVTVIDPNNPTDPNTPKPGEPVDPTDPNSPVLGELVETVTRTVAFQYEDGREFAPSATNTVTWTRTATYNHVTKTISYSEWVAKDADAVLEGTPLPTKEGYMAVSATSNGQGILTSAVEANITTKYNSDDIAEVVVFAPVAQKAVVKIVDITNPDIPTTLENQELVGKTDQAFGYDPATKLAELEKAGYQVVTRPAYDPTATFSADPSDVESFVYEVVQIVKTVDPNDPNTPTPKPGEPVDPKDPNSPVWPDTVKDLVTTEEVTRIISYVDNQGNTVFESVTETKKFTRTADINLVTGDITYGEWTPAQSLAKVTSPELADHLVSIPVVGAQDVAFDDPDINIQVVYTPLGSWVPVVPPGFPEVPETVYPVDPTDPSKPGTEVPTIPYIPGLVPVGPDGETPLKPIDPTDPTKGYEVPPVPEDPTQDTPITYVLADQKVTVNYVDEAGNPLVDPAQLTGKSGEVIDYSTTPTINDLLKKGYELVSNDYPAGATYDKDAAVDQVYTVVLKEKVVPVDPTNPNTPTPKPGEPVDPTDPNSPVWPDSVKDLVTTETVTRTISYVDNTGKTVFATVTETKTFTRTAEINLLTGVITYGEWTAAQTFAPVTSPTLANHLVDTPLVAGQDVNPTDADINVTVVYTPLGSWVPVVPPGFPEVPETAYPVDPEDPTKPGTEVPSVPHIPGTTPVTPDPENPGTFIPLTPVDPEDPSKGYEVPPVPTDPTKDTPIVYVEDNKQLASVTIVDESTRNTISTFFEQGKPGFTVGINTDEKLAELTKAGYTVTSDNYNDSEKVYDKDDNVDQSWTITVTPRIEPVDPTDPNTPTPKPGEPVDPTDPNSPVWPDSVKDLVTTQEVVRTITYVNEAGETVATQVVQKVNFTRTAQVNLVTGEVTYGEWTPAQELPAVSSPVVAGYYTETPLVDPATVNAEDADITVPVVYKKLGNWIPNIPGEPVNPLPYPNDPENPGVPGEPDVVIPYVPGYTPEDPNGNPLTPVDPEDPTKGYTPPTPENPGKDTPITYVADNQKAIVNYVDENGNPLATSGELTGKSGEPIDYSTTPTIEDLLKKGYELVNNEFPEGATYDKDGNVDQIFTVTLKERVEPVDPTNPPKPGEPVDPTDPNSPVWPDSVKDLVTTQEVVRTITYVNEAGETVSAEVVQKVSFTRTAEVNLVTGEITYGEWTAAQELPAVSSPVVAGYYTETPLVDPATVNAEDADVTVTVVYKKLGNWIPNIPGQPVNPLPYPNHPTDPSKPGVPEVVIPYVPGYVPVDPNGNPLTPVDPEDPSKGYIPPTPENPGVDTPITYVADDQKAIVNYVDENGNPLATSGDLTGKSGEPIAYSTTPTIEDLLKKGYELVNNEFPEGATYDKDGNVDQIFTVTLKERVEPVDPTNPPKPGEPVDPTDPNSPVWPDSVKDLVTTQEVVRTITYVNEAGETVSAEVVQKVSFTRTAEVNLVTGEITYGEWTAAQELPAVSSPVVAGYYTETPLVDPATVNAEDADVTVTVVYKKLGNWIPNIPGQPVNPLPYPNHPTDPSKPGVPEVVIPYVPGYVPVDPNGNPLTPVDPEDPTKGYIPPTPENPGVDTPITYIPVNPGTPVVPPVAPPTKPERPVSPETPEVPAQPVQPASPAAPAGPVVDQLPNTGESSSVAVTAIGASMLLAALALAGKRRRQEEE